MKLEQAIKRAEQYTERLFRQECRVTCWMTRRNIEIVKENSKKHAAKFIEMYSKPLK